MTGTTFLVTSLIALTATSAIGQQSRNDVNVGHAMNVIPQPAVTITRPGVTVPASAAAGSIRVRVKLDAAGPGNWSIAVVSAAGTRIETIRPSQFVEGIYWTDEVASGQMKLRLLNGTPEVIVAVDAYAVTTQLAQQQGVLGHDDSLPIMDPGTPPLARTMRGPVARIKFMSGNSGPSCTGFLLGKDLLMTNHHCISSEPARANARVEFGADTPGARVTPFKVTKIEALSYPLDYALLRLSANASAFGRMYLGADGLKGIQLLVIQHPDGGVKKAAFPTHCSIESDHEPGIDNKVVDFGHTCDTLGGSSGAPVLRWSDTLVVGLHHWTYVEGAEHPMNQAVRIQPIVDDLEALVGQGKLARATVDEVRATRR